MSNYTIAVAWAGKDALSDSDAAKVISGGDFNTEFTAVQTAVNTKAEVNGAAGESFSATTATAGTNTTQVATTAFVTNAVSASTIADIVYPVGAIFTTTTAYANSAAVVTAIGGTTWTVFGAGKVPVGVDSTDTDFDTIEETGGAKTHTLSESEIPSHDHTLGSAADDFKYLVRYTGTLTGDGFDNSPGEIDQHTGGLIQSVGGDQAHNNMPPYITVYMWKRTV
jgi:microcystin-dependent protein